MKLKLDDNGHVVVENGLPVFIHSDGKEIPFDAKQALDKIAELNNENKTHREAKQRAETELKRFEGIDNPDEALKALETLTKIDQKKLIDAGAVDQVKAEITKTYQSQIDEASNKVKELQQQLYNEMLGNKFNGSAYIQKNIAIPSEFLQARFGQNFKVEDGRITAYDQSGNKIYSRTKHGELADFDEALEFMVEQYPQKDHILKSSGNQGGGARPTQHSVGQKTMKRHDFDSLNSIERGKVLSGGITIID